jgi:kynureninase
MPEMTIEEFVDQRGIYLLSHSVGLPLKAAKSDAEEEFWQPWTQGDGDIWNRWLSHIERFRHQLGQLLNSNGRNFCPQTNISSAVTKIIFSLKTPAIKNIILMSEEDFPSVAFSLQQSQCLGYQLRYIPAGLDLNDMQVWDDYLTDDVALVLVTQVQSNNGVQLPIAPITALTKQRSIMSLVDIAQAIGILPIDIQQWSADFVVGSCVKWLSGGPGAGFMWVNPDIIEDCKPCDVGWFSHEDPFEFQIHNFRYAKDALRFWGGTPSVHPYLVAFTSLKFVCDIGVDTVRRHNLLMTDRIIEALDENDLISPLDVNCRSGTMIIHFGERHDHIVQLLHDNSVHFDSRSKGIRLSPHLYNSKEQIDTLRFLISKNR